MFETFAFYALPFTFTLLVACALTCLACGIFLLLFRIRATNEAMRHPYLDKHPWERYPLSIRAAIFMDYFLRIAFPKSSFWIIGQANRLLAHVQPDDVPSRIKWPLIGFWGGCFMGIAAMLVLWALILLTMA
ncbi:MAG TPA: hypothetical protein VIR76_11565 [Pusillimonas sp.]